MTRNKIVVVLVILFMGYVLGAKMPIVAQKLGIA